ncbi:MAG: hypothetical protein JO027_06580, partial [Solirubrobacterales bacterium]|nr:hypothetical protein [Solirubrobacterales bacterium]
WDLADIGVDAALKQLRDDGFGALELTACYHPITLYTPGAPDRRLMQMDQGAVFFPARLERYGRIQPRLFPEGDVLAVWPAVAELVGELGLDLNAWTVAMYQPWIAYDYPDTARVTPHGQRNTAGVCPSNPDVREFLGTLVGDLADQFPVRTVQLEGVTHPFFDTGWRLPRVLAELSPWTRWLASLCFCGSCIAAASDRGIEVDALRGRVCAELEDAFRSADPPDQRPWAQVHAERLAGDDGYAGLIAMRDDACVALVTEIAARLRAARPEAVLGIWGPEEFDGTRLDLDRVLPHVGVLQTRQPAIAPVNAARAREIADERGMRVTAVHWCGGRIGPPWGPEFEAALRGSVKLGLDQINLFNWAMLRPAVASAIVPLLRRIESEVHGEVGGPLLPGP